MDTHGGPAAATAIEAGERYFRPRLVVDWAGDGNFDHALSDMSDYVVSASTDQTVTGTAPEELLLIEGYSAASLELTLAGTYDDLSLVSVFSPYNGRSPLYIAATVLGQRVRYDLILDTAYGEVVYPQFRGIVRALEPDRGSDTVVMDCLDHVELMRVPVTLPVWAVWESYLQRGYKRGMLTDTSAVIDLAARAAGFSPGPLQQLRDIDTVALSVPLHGSLAPEVGIFDNDQRFHLTETWEQSLDPAVRAHAEAYRVGPFGQLAANAVPPGEPVEFFNKYWIINDALFTQLGTWHLSAWIHTDGPGQAQNSTLLSLEHSEFRMQLVITDDNLGVYPRIWDEAGFHDGAVRHLPAEDGWYHVQASFTTAPGEVSACVRVNNVVSEWEVLSDGGPPGTFPYAGLVTIEKRYPISDVLILHTRSGHDAPEAISNTPRGNAVISWGRNRLTHFPEKRDVEAWELAKSVAAAEYGVLFFDERGRFRFHNYDDVLADRTEPVRTLTLDDLEELGMRITTDSVRNVWSVTTTTGHAVDGIAYDLARDGVPLELVTTSEGTQEIPSQFIFGPRQYRDFVVYSPRTIMVTPTRPRRLGPAEPYTDVFPRHGYRPYSGPTYRHRDIGCIPRMSGHGQIHLDVWNGYPPGSDVVLGFVPPQRSAEFRIGGTVIAEQEPKSWSITHEASIATYGRRTLELQRNEWLQDQFQSRRMLERMVARTAEPIPATDSISMPGDPRLRLLDPITARDRNGLGAELPLQVYGITRTFTADAGLTDRYTVELTRPPGAGIWNSDAYGRWNTSFIWTDSKEPRGDHARAPR